MTSPRFINVVRFAVSAMSSVSLAFWRPRAGELAAMVVAIYVAALSAQQVTVSYDAFMLLDANERLETFQTLTPDNRAALLREQLSRWRQLHASRLTPQQEQVLTEVAGLIQPDMFTTTRRAHSVVEAYMALQRRVSEAFTGEDPREAFTLTGSHLPPK